MTGCMYRGGGWCDRPPIEAEKGILCAEHYAQMSRERRFLQRTFVLIVLAILGVIAQIVGIILRAVHS